MARKSTSTRTSKHANIEPSQLTLYVPAANVGGATPSTTQYLDLSQVASLVNRRFYRQGLNWAVAGVKVLSGEGFVGVVALSKLPNTWVMANSFKKSLAVWTKMNDDALLETESVRPRFLDFKVYADAEHHALGYGANLLPRATADLSTALLGEWESAKIFHPIGRGAVEGQTAEAEIIAVGANYPGIGASGLEAVSMIEGYAASRALPALVDPNVPADIGDTDNFTPENWMAAIFNEGTEQTSDVLRELSTENNVAPYPFEGATDLNPLLPGGGPNPNFGLPYADTHYPGGANQLTGMQIHDLEFIRGTTIGGTTRLKGGNFPCGLMRFDVTNTAEETNLVYIIDLIPGSHRGYLAESMQEM